MNLDINQSKTVGRELERKYKFPSSLDSLELRVRERNGLILLTVEILE